MTNQPAPGVHAYEAESGLVGPKVSPRLSPPLVNTFVAPAYSVAHFLGFLVLLHALQWHWVLIFLHLWAHYQPSPCSAGIVHASSSTYLHALTYHRFRGFTIQ